MSNRAQFVAIEDRTSSTKRVKHGVPQGSILGPLLFILYINDLPNISDKVQFILYADDANIVITAETEDEIISIYETFCSDLVKWVNVNGLFLNIKKTNYMIFTRKSNSRLETYIPQINGKEIGRKTVARFLGVLIDEKLTWFHHIAAVKAKMSRYIGTLYRLKKKLPLKARLLTFNCLVQSYINYCSLIWGTTNKYKIEQLFIAQKKAIRAIMPGNVTYYYKDGLTPTHTKPFYNNHNILTVQSIILKNIWIFMNKVHNHPHLLPKPVLDTIAADSPKPSNDDPTPYLSVWYQTYNTPTYRMTTFFKGPLLFSDLYKINDWITYSNITKFKTNAKFHLLIDVQHNIDCESNNLLPVNFPLYQVTGLRSSARIKQKPAVNYNEDVI